MNQDVKQIRKLKQESSKEMMKVSEFFGDEVVFDSVSSYLTMSDLLKLSQVSRQVRQVVQQKCKAIIKNHNLSLITTKTSIHQMRFYFDRCLTLYQRKQDTEQIKQQKLEKAEKGNRDKDKQREQKHAAQASEGKQHIEYQLSLTMENPFKFKTITYFEVGVQYTVCLTINREAFIFKTWRLIGLKEKKGEVNYQKRSEVAQIKCKGEHVTYLTESGEVWQMFGEKNSEKICEKEELVQWSNFIEIEGIEASFNYTVFRPKSSNVCYEEFMKYVYNYEIDLEKVKNSRQKNSPEKYHEDEESVPHSQTTLILLNNISLKYYFIQFDHHQTLTQIVVGNRQAYFLNSHYQTFVCYFQQEPNQNLPNQNFNHNKILKPKIFQPFIDKTIITLASGYNFFLALQRKIHDVSKWTVQQVCKWVREIGFGQFAKIFTVEKVNGLKLIHIDKNYMHSSLGITKPNMQQKFIMLLTEVIENKNKEDTLYGWGKNQNGQLCSRNANFIKEPQKIKPPTCFKESEYIDSIFCGWYETFIRTQKGRVYRTVNYEKKKKYNQNSKEDEQFELKSGKQGGVGIKKHLNEGKKGNADYEEAYDSQTEYEQKKNNGKGTEKSYHSKKKRKYTAEYQVVKKDQHHKKFEDEEKWIECEIGKAFFVQGYKDVLFFIQCPSQKQFEPTKQKKLRTAKMVLNKIIWSLGAEQQEVYKVGYMDKDMGLIETTILELKTFDYNENRIKYMKRGNQIVWDRENKIDHVG